MGVLAEVMAIKDRENAARMAMANLPQTLIAGFAQGQALRAKEAEIADLQSQAAARKGQANLDTLMKAATLKKNAADTRDSELFDLANAMQGTVMGTHTDYRQALDPAVASAMPPYVGPVAVTTTGSQMPEDPNGPVTIDEVVPKDIRKAMTERDKFGNLTETAALNKKMAEKMIEQKFEKEKPATEAEKTANIFATRAEAANKDFASLDDYISKQGFDKWAAKMAPNFLKGADQQRYEQAQRNFVNAVLRKESGAVISDKEFASAEKQYFPQPGDTPEVIAQKARNRQMQIDGLKGAAGKAFSGPKPSNKTSSNFVEGKTYRDAQGNQAVYRGGKWVPVGK